jgi:hypothetical protein
MCHLKVGLGIERDDVIETSGDFGVEEMHGQPVSVLDASRTEMGRTHRRYMHHMYAEPQVRLAFTRVPPS